MNFDKEKSFYIGIAIPFCMIFFLIAGIYIPRYLAPRPQYNFVYTENEYYRTNKFEVENGKIRERNNTHPKANREAKLMLYNLATHEKKELTFDEMKSLKVNEKSRSKDGYEIKLSLTSSHNYQGYLTGYFTSWPLNLGSNNSSKRFIGWIE